jgi:hypothetical protein
VPVGAGVRGGAVGGPVAPVARRASLILCYVSSIRLEFLPPYFHKAIDCVSGPDNVFTSLENAII